MRKSIALVVAILALAGTAGSQEKSEKFAIFVTGLESAAPVAQSLIKQMNASKPFEAVGQKDPSKVVVLVSCMPRKESGPFACMYVSHYNGPSFKTFLGAGMFFATTAEMVATNFLGSIAQDIVERYDKANIDNLREGLEVCLLLTDTKCNVPDPLQKEFDAKQLTLGQYFLKKC